jgi:serine/threonine protein kinase
MCRLVSGHWPSFAEPAGPKHREISLSRIDRDGPHAFLSPPEWASISMPCKELLKAMLAVSPGDRISPAEILAHPWISGGDTPSVPLVEALEGLRELRLADLQKVKQGFPTFFRKRTLSYPKLPRTPRSTPTIPTILYPALIPPSRPFILTICGLFA